MANSLTALNKEIWSRNMQLVREKTLCAMRICNFELRKGLSDGDKANKPYRSTLKAVDYTKGSDVTAQDVTATNEYLDVDQVKCVPIYVDNVDKVQNSYKTMEDFSKDMQADLSRQVDAKVLSEYDNATSDVDDGDIGGTASSSAVITPSNVNRLFTAAGKKLTNQNVGMDSRFAVISPSILEMIQLYLGSKDTDFGEKVAMNGLVGNRFGFEVYVSTNLTYTAKWTPADNPADTATITINGVTFTFVATIGTTPGNVLQTTSLAVTLDNLVDLINNPSSTTANHVALSQASQVLLEGCVATDGTTYLGIEFVGGGEVAVTTSEAADVWSVETVHCLFGQKGAIDLVLQRAPGIGFNQEPKRLPGSGNLIAWDLYGLKTFADGAKGLVDVNVDSSAF
ncbi:MAG: hypothetical protein ACOZBH_04515 [Patescibacteria group bacterium]